ncbi:MAG: tetratricopeptide repeat protein [Myxococcota bacterium]
MIPIWCLFARALAAPALEPAPIDFDSVIDQARFFLERERFADAQEQLELAVQTPTGASDAETWFLLAKVRYERGRLGEAEAAANQARRYSRNPSEFSQTQELYAFFRQSFGTLVLEGVRGARTTVTLDMVGTQLDPELKAYVQKWRGELASDGVVLPFSLGIPVGEYRVNGKSVTVEAGQTARVADAAVPKSGFGALIVDLGAGGLGWSADADLRPSGAAELAISVPFAGFSAGLVGRVVAQRFGVDDVTTEIGGSVGVRGGRAFRIGHPWVLVPAVNLSVGSVPGAGPERQSATALVVGPEVQASYRRTAHWSVGFTLGGDRVIGRLPADVQGNRGFGAWQWSLRTSVGYRL